MSGYTLPSMQQPGLIQRWISFFVLCACMLLSSIAWAEDKFLPSEQAFKFEARSINQQQVTLHWDIADDYYLYKHQFEVKVDNVTLSLDLPAAKPKHDEFFGDTEVYYDRIDFDIAVQPNRVYEVVYQGCAEKGLCYPISQSQFKTDQDGLVVLAEPSLFAAPQKGLFDSAGDHTDTSSETPAPLNSSINTEIAPDQQWSTRLHEQSYLWSMILFLGLGCLLAFTPCSLPMLPILSSLLIRKHIGVKAGAISVVFVLAMASVYALLGIVAASAGSNFQRWLQQPAILIGFSTIFILFALNLFGVFELKLPHSWSNRLDQLQARQKGGTLAGAALMGMLSALLVGPCMTAPLAGTLLYISQTQNIVIGASLLFCLGLGMGIPLILLSLIGQKAVPKPGQWMHYVRHVFAFMMLGLSLYFVRPLLTIEIFNLCLLVIALALAGYLVWLALKERVWIRYSAIVVLLALLAISGWKGTQYWQYQTRQQEVWQVVTTQQQFEQTLQQAKQLNRPIIVDLYADWCIACQPIERDIWTNPDIQQQLASVTKIKIDLSRYDTSQKALLNKWQMLGPPTVLFLDQNGQEQRELRLTGSFKKARLLENLQHVN